MAKVIGEMNGFDVYDELPEGWRVVGFQTQPDGYVGINNGKTRFAMPKVYRNGLITEETYRRCLDETQD